ncbi:hypothetical protein llap_32 [Limosa lapponica baueri]|uniref:Uncharacterized protein n=1 Tax=Limosa lapponica baueri TaxID=1758121 RepID=A0A2I0UUF8_LIMLA|nr:hypothetical protein llap_32 [Limosa lapponica baueri]
MDLKGDEIWEAGDRCTKRRSLMEVQFPPWLRLCPRRDGERGGKEGELGKPRGSAAPSGTAGGGAAHLGPPALGSTRAAAPPGGR